MNANPVVEVSPSPVVEVSPTPVVEVSPTLVVAAKPALAGPKLINAREGHASSRDSEGIVACARSVPESERMLIEVREVYRQYGALRAVEGLSFEVYAGEIVALLGPNGAGKTTMLRMLATLLAPNQGSVRVAGFDTQSESLQVRSHLGYQTGDTGLYGRLSPLEFLRYFGRLHQMEASRLEQRIAEVVEAFGISDFASRRCGELSTGQKQRVSLARTMLDEPRVLVLDEPTAGLDIVSSAFVLETLVRARNEARAVLFSTHVLSEVELVADRVLVMHRGRLIAEGSCQELMQRSGGRSLSHTFLELIREHDSMLERGASS